MDQVQRVPFLDLTSQIAPIRDEILKAVEKTIDASDFILGPQLEVFEKAFADHCDCQHAVGVSSGTDALLLGLRALGVGPGDEVITAPNMFIAAAEAIVHTGATAVLADVREDTFCLDPDAVEKAITKSTKAVIPVHLFGQPCEMDALMELSGRHGFFVLEDACQAHGATYKGKKTGSLGHAAAFSFYPSKNLGAFGDGGAVTTNDSALADRIMTLRHHGQSARNTHGHVGYNSRLDSVQAAVMNVKLPHLDRWNERRRELADRYRSRLEGTEFVFQTVTRETVPVYHVLGVCHSRRDLVHEGLDRAGIGWGKHIGMPIHQQPAYRFLGYKEGDFPVSEKLCEELVSLPIDPSLSDGQVEYVCETLAKVAATV